MCGLSIHWDLIGSTIPQQEELGFDLGPSIANGDLHRDPPPPFKLQLLAAFGT
jgi:hypothetical protein